MKKSTYLVLFSFGPVQSFISKSRKLKDLFNASNILSDISKLLIEDAKKEGFSILSPALNNNKSILPNRFLAKIEGTEPTLVAKVLEIEKRAKMSFVNLSQTLLQETFPKKTFPITFLNKWDKQTSSQLEFYWVSNLLSENFSFDYQKLNKDLAALKNEKTIVQNPEVGRKCTLEGDLNALIYRRSSVGKTPKYIKGGYATSKKQLNPGEGLSAIGFLKRFYSNAPFDSTAAFALSHLKEKLKENEILQEFENSLPSKENDDQLFYPENQNQHYAKKQGINLSENKLKKIKSNYYSLKDELKKKNLKLHNHYAVLVFDGDNAGKWLSGNVEGDMPNLEVFQKKVSSCLEDFSYNVKSKVNDNWGGMTIYAGGDDFIGFLHIEELLETLIQIKQLFNEKVNRVLKNEFKTRQDFTISGGLAIAHYSENLGRVIQFARGLEAKSKENEKNKISLAIVTRSAHNLTTDLTISWTSLEIMASLFKYFRIRAGTEPGKAFPALISNNFLKSITARYRHLNLDENIAFEKSGDLQNLIGSAFPHFINQSYNGPRNEKEETLKQVNELLVNLKNQGVLVNEITRMIQLLEGLSRFSTAYVN